MIVDNTFENNLIRVGENAEENSKLISDSKQTDLWFHLDNLPSCHVVISCNKKNPVSSIMIQYCAKLCKQHTKYKNYYKLKVMYTEIKNVKKTKTHGKVTIKGKSKIVVI